MIIRSISKLWVKFEEPNAPVIRSVTGRKVEKVHITIFDTFGHMVHENSVVGKPAGEFNGEFYYDYAWSGPKNTGVYTAVVDGEVIGGEVVDGKVQGEKLTGRTTFAVMGGDHEKNIH